MDYIVVTEREEQDFARFFGKLQLPKVNDLVSYVFLLHIIVYLYFSGPKDHGLYMFTFEIRAPLIR